MDKGSKKINRIVNQVKKTKTKKTDYILDNSIFIWIFAS